MEAGDDGAGDDGARDDGAVQKAALAMVCRIAWAAL